MITLLDKMSLYHIFGVNDFNSIENFCVEQNIHLVAEISKSSPYVGEGIYAEYRLYVSENVSVYDTSVTEAPQYNGFWNQEIKIDGFNGEHIITVDSDGDDAILQLSLETTLGKAVKISK